MARFLMVIVVLTFGVLTACAPAAAPTPPPPGKSTAAPTTQPAATPAAQPAAAKPAYKVGTPDKPIRIGTAPATPFLPVYAAVDKLKKDYGLNVKIVEISSSSERTLALVKGDVDVYVGGTSTLLMEMDRGQPIVFFSNDGTLGTGIVVRPEIKSWQDLKGKTIMTTKNSIMHIQLIEELKANGLDPDKDVKLEFSTRYPDMNAALKQGQIAGISGLEPFLSQAVVEGYGHFLSYPYKTSIGWRAQGAFAAMESFVKENPEVIQAIATTHLEVVKQYHEHPNEFLDAVMKYQGHKPDFKPIAEAALHNTDLLTDYDKAAMADLKATAEYLVKLKVIKKVPDLDKYVTNKFMDEAAKQIKWNHPDNLHAVFSPPAWDPAYKYPSK
ncbi:MAG: ABC transporter substrate-binding protein [Dehalococcoidales bacterium]|nr:ABC transporter substrate-binding protein [Dehalococcoidales bacterium]